MVVREVEEVTIETVEKKTIVRELHCDICAVLIGKQRKDDYLGFQYEPEIPHYVYIPTPNEQGRVDPNTILCSVKCVQAFDERMKAEAMATVKP